MDFNRQENEYITNLAEAFGAEKLNVTNLSFIIYVPHKDRHDKPITNYEEWINYFIELLSSINGGTTTVKAYGSWLENKLLIHENSSLIESFIFDGNKFFNYLPKIKEAMNNFGKKTNQAAVAFMYDGLFFTKTNYED